MKALFIKLLEMSFSASWVILAVLLLRLFLKKTPKWITCLLWGVVALRLLMPFTPESALSLVPSTERIEQNITFYQAAQMPEEVPEEMPAYEPMVSQNPAETPAQRFWSIAPNIWLIGMAGMLIYAAVSYGLLRRQVQASVLLRDQIYVCDQVQSPFVLGVMRPKIYIPSGMEDDRLQYVLAHEYAHIQRRDHWWKPLGFFLLMVYWFNPLLWVSYVFLCRDIEQACDEKVISGMDGADKRGYSEALVACSVHRRRIMACPLAFGEVGVKTRIKGILHYKKPAFWIMVVALTACVATAVCFLTDPKPCKHSYTGKVTLQPTCVRPGTEEFTCSLCQHTYTEPVAVCAHSYSGETVVKASTCMEQGVKESSCTVCGEKKTETIEKAAHTAGALTVTKEPNCIEAGEKTACCTLCNAVCIRETIEPNGIHEFFETVETESTCTQNGQGTKTCSRCSYSEGVSYDLREHDYVRYLCMKPTCRATGHNSWICMDCSYVKVETLPRDPNNHFGPIGKYCTACGEYLGGQEESTGNLRGGNRNLPIDQFDLPSWIPDVSHIPENIIWP